MPRPKNAPKVSVSKTFDTKTALRTAFNALKATGNLFAPKKEADTKELEDLLSAIVAAKKN